MKNKRLNFILSFVPVALIAVGALTGCGGDNSNSATVSSTAATSVTTTAFEVPSETSKQATDIGEGEISFLFEVTDDAGDITSWNVHTALTTVGAALIGEGLIEGEESSYGLYVKSVNGLTADFDADGAYWAFYVNGEYAEAGVDQTDIEEGKTYAFVYTKG